MPHSLNLDPLLAPNAVAVIGASRNPAKAGHALVRNLIQGGYRGKVFPVNPNGGEIAGVDVLRSLDEIGQPVDLALICLPMAQVPEAVAELGRRQTRAAAVLTAGFREAGAQGHRLAAEVADTARQAGMLLLGPGSLGLANPSLGLSACLSPVPVRPGRMAFFAQSGALCSAVLRWAHGAGLGFSRFVSLGDKARIGEPELLDHLARDPETRVILGCCESLEDGRAFMQAASRATRIKPVVLLKIGSTTAGARAASARTGVLSGSGQAFASACVQSGVIQVGNLAALFDLGQAFATQPLPLGPNLAVVTNAGGAGILAADACENSRLNLVRPSQSTLDRLWSVLPPQAALYNPVDVLPDAGPERLAPALSAVLDDDAVHAALVVLAPVAGGPPGLAQAVAAASKASGKPVACCLLGDHPGSPDRETLAAVSVPCYEFPEGAVAALEAMHRYREHRDGAYPVEVCYRRDRPRAEKAIRAARARGAGELPLELAQEVALAYELPLAEAKLARTSDEAVKLAGKTGYPVVLKISSPQIAHKREAGGVRTGLTTPEEVRRAFQDLTTAVARRRTNSFIQGCLVQKMAPPGSREVVLGFTRDPQYGPLLRFGQGGVHLTVFRDVAFRLAPLSLDDAQAMIREIRSLPLLRGVAGDPPADVKALEDILLTLSQLAMDFPEIHEATLDPVLAGPEGALVADVRLALDQA